MNVRSRVLPLLFVAALAVASHSSSEAALEPAICFGQVATIVGPPGEMFVYGTNGPDVIVTNGAEGVWAQSGDDLVCVTDPRSSGVAVYLGPGADRFLGSPVRDSVYADDEGPGEVDRDVIHTGGGSDIVSSGSRKSGAGASQDWIELGDGHDSFQATGPVSLAATLSGGNGSDQLVEATRHPRGVAVTIDNRREELRSGGEVVLDWDGFERFIPDRNIQGPFTFRGSAVREKLGAPSFRVGNRWKVNVLMGGGRDWASIGGGGKSSQVDGGPGADWLRHWDRLLSRGGVRIYGRAGNDRLIGSSNDDTLIGGPGHDDADGRDGIDRCRAEIRTRCESR